MSEEVVWEYPSVGLLTISISSRSRIRVRWSRSHYAWQITRGSIHNGGDMSGDNVEDSVLPAGLRQRALHSVEASRMGMGAMLYMICWHLDVNNVCSLSLASRRR